MIRRSLHKLLQRPIETSPEVVKGRMLSIDALRGLAAFLVVLVHVFGTGGIYSDGLTLQNYLYLVPAYGFTGVYLFFVISGFCIHIRWAKAKAYEKDCTPNIDFLAFWKRRWIRLYPAYIAAIILYLAVSHVKIDLNGFFVWDMVSHVLMIHNLDNRTVYSMNGVFWTLAIEEQLYLLYFVFLRFRERLGWGLTLVITFVSRFLWFAISLVVTKTTSWELPFHEGSLAYWWVWVLGALAVENYYKVIELPKWCRSLSLSSLLLICAGVVRYVGTSSGVRFFNLIMHAGEAILWGTGFFVLINYVVGKEFREGALIRGVAFVGLFSYSLYLTHEALVETATDVNPFILCALCLAFAYGFYLIFEKPFMVYLAKQKGTIAPLSPTTSPVRPVIEKV
jgi:peptidoglycan/LPS O-acetylase OafA/YrhL